MEENSITGAKRDFPLKSPVFGAGAPGLCVIFTHEA
jgi:hypothetical protein